MVVKVVLLIILIHASFAATKLFFPATHTTDDQSSIALIPVLVVTMMWYMRAVTRLYGKGMPANLLLYLGLEVPFSARRVITPALIVGGLATLISPSVWSAATVVLGLLAHLGWTGETVTESRQPAAPASPRQL